MKIAFLFLTVAGIFHEKYWADFLKGYETHYSMYIHSKNGVPENSLFKKYELNTTVPTSWAHTLKAELLLLKIALSDPENQMFILVSESTLPLQSFQHIYDTLEKTKKSCFVYMRNPHQDPDDICYASRNLHEISEEHRYKNTQWIGLVA